MKKAIIRKTGRGLSKRTSKRPLIVQRRRDRVERAIGQSRVGVEEEDDVAPRFAGARVHLTRAAAGTREGSDLWKPHSDLDGTVIAAAIGDNHLRAAAPLSEIRQQALEVGRLVERGNDETDQEETRAVSLRLQS